MNAKQQKAPFSGSTFLITGAGFDIGKELSKRCATQGAHVILMDSDNRALNSIYDEIVKSGATEPTILHLKPHTLVGENAALIRQQILAEHKKLDALIHTANVAFALTPANLLEEDVMNKALNILHTQPHVITRELYPALEAAEKPSVIFTSHFSSHTNKPFWGYHAGAFAALEATARQWAAQTKNKGFSINSIDPGAVKTSVRKKHYPAEEQAHLCNPGDEAIMSMYLNLLSTAGKERSGEHFILPDIC